MRHRSSFRRLTDHWVVAAAVVLGVVAIVTPAQAESIMEALKSAYLANPQIDAERATLRATDEGVPQARAGYRPTVTGTADAGVQSVKTDPGSPADGETHPHGYKVTATQPLYSGGQVLNGVRVAEAKVRSERENLRIVEMQVLLSAATAYMNVVRDRSLLRLQENNVKVLAETLRSTQERFNVGEVTRTDVAQAQASLEASKAQLETAKANLKNDAATYEQVITHPPGALTEPRPLDSLVPRSLSEGLRTGEQENPNVIIAQVESSGTAAIATLALIAMLGVVSNP